MECYNKIVNNTLIIIYKTFNYFHYEDNLSFVVLDFKTEFTSNGLFCNISLLLWKCNALHGDNIF